MSSICPTSSLGLGRVAAELEPEAWLEVRPDTTPELSLVMVFSSARSRSSSATLSRRMSRLE